MQLYRALAMLVVTLSSTVSVFAADGNRLTYLDEYCDPYYVGRDFPKLITPQWVGDEGVEAVVVLAIDDMRDTAKYEAYLRPILDRLKKIDGRAPVSIMTCSVDPKDPQLAKWIEEGLSIECHTIDHPCPLLQGGDFAKAKSTYDRCVDLMNEIPGNKPVAFRMPCCDSRNTPSPRFWTEIFNKRTEKGHYLAIDSSVFNITTPNDKDLPRELVLDEDGSERFRKYLPFPSFVNTIEDYPYPYVIGGLCWEFPCMVPSDWEAQNLHRPNNPKTVEDLKAALDVVVLKQGVFNLVFHPYGWIRSEQVVEFIDHAVEKHGDKVRFLTFAECLQRLNQHLLGGRSLRDKDGNDAGVQLIDVDQDGYLDVVIRRPEPTGTDGIEMRRWRPREREWKLTLSSIAVPHLAKDRQLYPTRYTSVMQAVADRDELYPWPFPPHGYPKKGAADDGLRCRDLDGDGSCEVIIGNPKANEVFRWDLDESKWSKLPFALPPNTFIVDDAGRDAGLRFVDVNGDGRDDVIFSNGDRYSLHLFNDVQMGWSVKVIDARRGDAEADGLSIPMIVRPDGTNNGVWFHSGHLWVQNEDTNRLPDGVDRRSFENLLKSVPK